MRTIILTAALLLAGCASDLETGYKPHKLGASEAERRSFYASPFSPESRGAENDKAEMSKARRPNVNY